VDWCKLTFLSVTAARGKQISHRNCSMRGVIFLYKELAEKVKVKHTGLIRKGKGTLI
jgi:hypothetical protein